MWLRVTTVCMPALTVCGPCNMDSIEGLCYWTTHNNCYIPARLETPRRMAAQEARRATFMAWLVGSASPRATSPARTPACIWWHALLAHQHALLHTCFNHDYMHVNHVMMWSNQLRINFPLHTVSTLILQVLQVRALPTGCDCHRPNAQGCLCVVIGCEHWQHQQLAQPCCGNLRTCHH
jgi:hypothetical protein